MIVYPLTTHNFVLCCCSILTCIIPKCYADVKTDTKPPIISDRTGFLYIHFHFTYYGIF